MFPQFKIKITIFNFDIVNILYPVFFLASQDALEVMRVTEWLSNWVSVSIDFTDVTLVSDDTYRRLYWCDLDDPDESYLVMKAIQWWKLPSVESYQVMKVT